MALSQYLQMNFYQSLEAIGRYRPVKEKAADEETKEKKKAGIINQYFRVQGRTQMEGMINGNDNRWISKLLRDKWWVLHIASVLVYVSSYFSRMEMIGNLVGFSLNIIFLLYTWSLTRPPAEVLHIHSEDGQCCH